MANSIGSSAMGSTNDLAAMFKAFMAAQASGFPPQLTAPVPQSSGKWDFKVLSQEGTAAIVMATPPKGAAFRAMATVSPEGRVKLGFKLDGNTLAKGFVKLLGSIQ